MKRPILSTAFILATLMGSTIMAKADNLKDALTTAYINNPSLGAARASQRATDETVNQATGGWRPQIIGSGSMARTDGSRTGVGFLPSQQITKPKSIGISIEQPVFRSFQTVNGTREARAQATAGRAQLENVEQQVFMATVQAYSDVIRDEAFLEFTTTNVVALQRQLQASEDRFEVGEITRTDVAQSKARLSRAQSEKILSEATLTASRAAYQRAVGNEPGTLERDITLPPLPASEEAAYDIASRNHPVIVGAKASESAANFAVKKQYGGLGPSINVGASYTKSWDSFLAGDTNTAKTVS
ncbi:MAG: TolC family protein, partial [Kordiimonadaceae bacterium]|nr:TolC family protein [Kordiimonadaceae bacterium]